MQRLSLIRTRSIPRTVYYIVFDNPIHHAYSNSGILYKNTTGDSPRRADARLGSAHAPSYRECRQIEAVNATQYCQGVPSKNKSCLNKEKENTGVRFNEPATNLAIRHTMTNSSREQQHCCCSNNSGIATDRAAAAAAAAALCKHINLTSRLSNKHAYFYTGKKKEKKKKKNSPPRFELRTPRAQRQRSTCYSALFLVYTGRDWYVYIRTNRRMVYFDKKTKTAPAAGRRREHGRGRLRQSRERRARCTSSKHDTDWWTSSRARALTSQNLV